MADIDLRVPVFDFDTGEFVTGLDGTVKTVTGSEAVGMIAVKAEETERGVFPVYGDDIFSQGRADAEVSCGAAQPMPVEGASPFAPAPAPCAFLASDRSPAP